MADKEIRLYMGCMREYDRQYEVCPYCGYWVNTPRADESILSPGTMLRGRYIVGQGTRGYRDGMGLLDRVPKIVYMGLDCVSGKRLCVEEYFPDEGPVDAAERTQGKKLSVKPEKAESFEKGLQSVLDQAKQAGQLQGVKGIIQVCDFFRENGTAYVLTEYKDGMSLGKYCRMHGSIPENVALDITIQVASAVVKLYQAGIQSVNLDMDHIRILNPDGADHPAVELYDFGDYCFQIDREYLDEMDIILPLSYVAPERCLGKSERGSWTDVYALAAVCYKLITGVAPEDSRERIREDHLKKPSERGIKISQPVETALMNALRPKAEERTRTMEEFIRELTAEEVAEHPVATGEFRANGETENSERGMKWFKFIIWFQLFVAAVMGMVSAIVYMKGLHYGGSTALVYSLFSGMKTLDRLVGSVMFVEAVACIVVRQKLAGFCKGAPAMYLTIGAVNAFLPIVYLMLAAWVMRVSMLTLLNSSVLASVITGAVLLAVNAVYFANREDLFVN
ncbi:MAG: protein kinase [Clostridiales bacterium]|nr:protein kinase [Clostridiales bacterium]